MTEANMDTELSATDQVKDVVLVGLGVTGVYQLYRLVEAGYTVQALEAGDGVGGTWYWNKYPGCRFDSESYTYGYFFDNKLYDEWEWSEHFAGQPEIERYINHVVDRYDLRKHIKLSARVKSMTYDADTNLWTTVTEAGESFRSKFVVTALGLLSDPYYPDFAGMDDFKGPLYHTARWPKEGIDYKGKRVAIIGSAASAVQAAPIIAKEAAHLTILQRTPNWCAPLNNKPHTEEEKARYKGAMLRVYNEIQDNYGGFVHKQINKSALDVSDEDREAHFEYLYRCSGLSKYLANFKDISTNEEANRLYTEFYAKKIRERIKDPAIADKVIPKDHGFGIKRPPMETGYYEMYNRDNVDLVQLREEPIVRITETGIELPTRTLDFDIIILATGFDALTGCWNKIDIRGKDGVTLKQSWADSPQNYLGTVVKDFPNFLMVGGPHASHGNIFRSTQHHADFIVGLLNHMRDNGIKTVDVGQDAMDVWLRHVDDRAKPLLAYGKDNYASGANIPGKPRYYLLYHAASAGAYRDELQSKAAAGYPELVFGK
ncbi:NAD(P)/FAD-dependent oxidoreductase [soil metagenome]